MTFQEVVNPRTGSIDYTFQHTAVADLANTVNELRVNQPTWEAKGVEKRVEVLQRFAGEVKKSFGRITAALSKDTGRVAMCNTEVGALLGFIAMWGRLGPMMLKGSKSHQDARAPGMCWISYTNQLVPIPVVANIAPWNYPIILSFLDTVPALVAGCAVVIKPSEVTPRWVVPLFEAVQAVPELAAVLKVVMGPGCTVGNALIKHVDAVVLTGSTAVGKLVAQQCAERLIPAFLELGGNDPAIVLASADVEHAAKACVRAAVVSTGQSCMSVERVYVHTSIYDRFVEEALKIAATIRLNFPDINDGHIGPFISGSQAAIVAAHASRTM